MKKTTLILAGLFRLLSCFAQDDISIIPQPVKLTKYQGHFILPSVISISADENPVLKTTLADLGDRLTVPTGYHVAMTNSGSAVIRINLNKSADSELGNEGYRLLVTPKKVTITANQPAGIFYGVQSFLQLLPPEIENNTKISSITWSVPCVSITDYPRFGWRGLMLDVSRHFFTKEEVKKYMIQMARYKYNVLHLHLSDDQGWRIEIKSLPQLTSVGAWRAPHDPLTGRPRSTEFVTLYGRSRA